MRQCALCGKTSTMAGERRKLRGKYNPVNWSRKYPNLQYGKVDGKRALICTTCMRTQAKPKRVIKRKTVSAEAK